MVSSEDKANTRRLELEDDADTPGYIPRSRKVLNQEIAMERIHRYHAHPGAEVARALDINSTFVANSTAISFGKTRTAVFG